MTDSPHSGFVESKTKEFRFSYKHQPSRGEKMKKLVEMKKTSSTKGFGSAVQRFSVDELTISPGVGQYNLLPSESSMLLASPSVSKKGYGVSTAPKLSFITVQDVPGPNSYPSTHKTMSEVMDSPTKRPSTAFIPSGDGRVPFPPPNKVPGPNAYKINHDPGTSPFLKKKNLATFLSITQRNSYLHVNDNPPPLRYECYGSGPPAKHDVQWSKSNFTRFQDIGKDNRVPGPQRYFDERMEEDYFPKKILRTAGTYDGPYVGKLQDEARAPPTTFGADLDRFKNSVYGRLDVIAQIPGPGAYFDDLNFFSTVKNASPGSSPRRNLSPPKTSMTKQPLQAILDRPDVDDPRRTGSPQRRKPTTANGSIGSSPSKLSINTGRLTTAPSTGSLLSPKAFPARHSDYIG